MNKNIDHRIAVLGCFTNGCGIFCIPLMMIIVSSMIFGASEIADTFNVFSILCLVFIVPSFISLLGSAYIKVKKDLNLSKPEGMSSFVYFCNSVRRHTGILTFRGWGLLLASFIFIVLTMFLQWASLGTAATFFLLLFYGTLGVSSLVSALMVGSFEQRLSSKKGYISRKIMPAVVLSGATAEERFDLKRIPVPSGFILLIEDNNLPVLETSSRYATG
ncbi:MAG: hypothetical protein CMK59_03555, partial [Proteobacteria bacterium]|nr:hypothetical protein [Pseudomonadota bacterium]